ncbi:MAG: adenylate/guanylate cyclase domain-containing protein [Thermoanaerobaculia bacterium]|nr:adenylate/guanylate cyclase domain-containing protein [Thermoanaerobaculia bacterium]
MTDPRFDTLREVADAAVVAAIEELVATGSDSELSRLDPLRFAADRRLPEDRVLDAFVHAAKLALFEMSWNLLCPGCGGVLDVGADLKQLKEHYNCSLCAAGYEPEIDSMVEVSFTVSQRLRRIAAHEPDVMSPLHYYRDLYFSNALVMPQRESDYAAMWQECVIESEEVAPGEKVVFSIQLPSEFVILFEPVTHSAKFLDVKGDPTRERRDLTVTYTDSGVPTATEVLAPGPLRLTLVNRTARRVLPCLFLAGERFHQLFENRQPFLTAKRIFTNQTFRDLYRAESLSIDQRLKIASMTVLFTDLKGSTELYERVGDLVAYDLVRAHFRVLGEVVRRESGAVVKTIGDAVMATFPSSDQGFAAAVGIRKAMEALNGSHRSEDLLVKIGLHEGPCLAVISNDRLDYFGQTVNVAARVQGLASSHAIFATEPVVENERVKSILSREGMSVVPHRAMLKGIADALTVFEIG